MKTSRDTRVTHGLRVLFLSDVDDLSVTGGEKPVPDSDAEFGRPATAVLKAKVGGGVSLPRNLARVGLVGLSLLFTRVTLGVDGSLANLHHIIGSLVLTEVTIAAADVARPAPALNALLSVGLMCLPFLCEGSTMAAAVTIGSGLALVLLSIGRGPVEDRYGHCNRWLVQDCSSKRELRQAPAAPAGVYGQRTGPSRPCLV